MYVFGLIVFALFGLLFGSFGNVVIYRLPRGESLSHPGSHCPECESAIKPSQNIPLLSYLLLKGKCQNCATPISVRYPIIEALSALLFCLAYVMANNIIQALFLAALFYHLLLLSAIDFDLRRLPNPLVASLALFGVLGVGASYFTVPASWKLIPLINSLSQAYSVAPFFGALSKYSALSSTFFGLLLGVLPILLLSMLYYFVRKRNGFGMGDIKLLAALSPFLGFATIAVLPLAAFVALFALVFARKSIDSSTKIPFGPFISIATVLILLFTLPVSDWYLSFML